MQRRKSLSALTATAIVAVCAANVLPVSAATIDAWNTANVDVAATPLDGVTGVSVVYDRPASDAGAVSNGQILFTPPEAVSPGIIVDNVGYVDSGPDGIDLAGCIMTSSDATCTGEFQSGKRIKQKMTGLGPVDLVFDISEGADSVYQVFHRLINGTGTALNGFAIELGFGTGGGFERAGSTSGLSFSSLFSAQPTGSGSASSQFPFGLFGDAASNDNFTIDGFFADARTGFEIDTTDPTSIVSSGFYGPYDSIFENWLSGEDVPEGAFWDNDNDPLTDALLMAWFTPEGMWEMRREILALGVGTVAGTAGTLDDVLEFASFDELLRALLGDDYEDSKNLIAAGAIEDLANLNVNFAIALGDMGDATSFTLRSTVFPAPLAAVPLPAGGLLLLSAFGLLAATRRRRV